MDPQAQAGSPQQQVIDRLKTAVNVLVTVSNSPSVDQLAAAIGFTLTLNKMGKHATAVFSGDVPSTLEFLKPEETLEKDTNSLRDFIVSLDKSKADKLRYKVEENVVKIFITPYRTSLSEADLNFSQGDFNVDAVVALGVSEREQLDQAIISHGRILHDATVITISAGKHTSKLGAINLHDPEAASLCEILVTIAEVLQPGLLDNQIATAYLTGIVAETERFRNEKTTPKAMTLAAQLMMAGANQQLISKELEHETVVPHDTPLPEAATSAGQRTEKPTNPDGSLTIAHTDDDKPAPTATLPEPPKPETDEAPATAPATGLPEPVEEAQEDHQEEKTAEIHIDEHGNMKPAAEADKQKRRIIEPLSTTEELKAPSNTAQFTANMTADGEDEPSSDPLSLPPVPNQPILDHGTPGGKPEPEAVPFPPALDDNTLRDLEMTFDSQHIVQDPSSKLNEIEEVTKSPHFEQAAGHLDTARDAVQNAIQAAPFDPGNSPLSRVNSVPLEPAVTDPTLQGLGLTDAVQPQQTDAVLPPPPAPEQSASRQTAEKEEVKDASGQTPPTVPPPFY